jgi:hypothetical protein
MSCVAILVLDRSPLDLFLLGKHVYVIFRRRDLFSGSFGSMLTSEAEILVLLLRVKVTAYFFQENQVHHLEIVVFCLFV